MALRRAADLARVLACVITTAAGCTGSPMVGPDDAVGDGGDATRPDASSLRLMAVGGSDLDGLAFVPLDDCPELPIIHGIQGGYHVWGSVHVRDVSPIKALVRVRLRDMASGELVAPGDVTLSLDLDTVPDADGGPPWLERNGLPVYVADPCPIDGHELRLEGKVVDLYGVEREAEGCLIARMLPEWRASCAAASQRE